MNTINDWLGKGIFLSLLFLSGFSNELSAQVEPDFLAVVEADAARTEESDDLRKNAAHYYRHFKKLSPLYQGYLIELVVADAPLKRDFPIFQYFGNVHYQRLKNGKIAYYIIGKDFSSKKNIKQFIKNVVVHRAPKARLVVRKK